MKPLETVKTGFKRVASSDWTGQYLSLPLLEMLLCLLLVAGQSLGLELVPSSPGKECSSASQCGTRTSCPYWLERERNFKDQRDDTYLADARRLICNVRRKALCCPREEREEEKEENVDVESPTYIPKANDCGVNPAAPPKFIFGGNETNPGDYPFSALLGKQNISGEISM